jgi:hypothetical protein
MFDNWQGMFLRDEFYLKDKKDKKNYVDGLILDLFGLMYTSLNHFSLHTSKFK